MNAEQLVGAWTLDAVWAEDDDGARMHPLGERPRGVLVYAREGLFSVTVTAAERPVFEAPDILLGSPAEKARAAETCLAYAGRWSLRAGRVIHAVEVSLFPNWVGVEQERIVRLAADRLELSTDPMLLGDARRRVLAVWRRAV